MYKLYYNQLVKESKVEPAHNQGMIDALDRWILECNLNITDYNDGWTISHYKKELKKAEKLRKSWGTQLKIPFPNE